MTSYTCCRSRPAARASARASAPAARFAAASRLLTILNVDASPGRAPSGNRRPAIRSRISRTRAKAAGSPDTIIVIVPAAALAGPPETGASSSAMPCAASRGASAVTYAGSTVDDTSTMRCRATCRDHAVRAEQDRLDLRRVDHEQHDDRRRRGRVRRATPSARHRAATASACASARMSRAYVATPARTRLCTTPPPIAPVPMTPTRSAVALAGCAPCLRLSLRRSSPGARICTGRSLGVRGRAHAPS